MEWRCRPGARAAWCGVAIALRGILWGRVAEMHEGISTVVGRTRSKQALIGVWVGIWEEH